MPRDLVTDIAFTVGLGPGKAVEFRPGEILAFPDDVAARLLKLAPVHAPPADAVGFYRIPIKDREIPAVRAAGLSPHHDAMRLKEEAKDVQAATEIATLKAQLTLALEQIAKLQAK